MPLTQRELESKLWGAADILRGQIDSSDYKNFIFSLLFLKRLSDRFQEEVEKAVSLGVDRAVAENDPEEHEFFVPADCRWSELSKGQIGLGEVLNRASMRIEEANESFEGIFKTTNWSDDSKLSSSASRDRWFGCSSSF